MKSKRPPGWVNPAKGKPNGRAEPTEIRFWKYVEKGGPKDCWLWTGSLIDGHGQFYAGKGQGPYSNGCELAHRYSWKLHGGTIPDGMVIDHKCRVRRCQNPAHMRVVTPRVNGTENNVSPLAVNAQKTHCQKCGNAYEGANLALYLPPRRFNRHGNPRKPTPTRICLTCIPSYWRWAVIPRDPPPGARPWREPRRKAA